MRGSESKRPQTLVSRDELFLIPMRGSEFRTASKGHLTSGVSDPHEG